MDDMREVEIRPTPLVRLAEVLPPERGHRLAEYAAEARVLLEGRTVWNISSTAQGGGVAELLQTLLAYGRGAGIDTRWLVIEGDAEFFSITKRLHNLLHGGVGDGGGLGDCERAHFAAVLGQNLEAARNLVRPGDIVLLHDPQPAGMVAGLRAHGAYVVWRCHIGRDTRTEQTDLGWAFLREFIEAADAFIFSRPAYAPDWVPQDRLHIIAPSLDPFSAKNAPLSHADMNAALREAGLVDTQPDRGSLAFTRRDGSSGTVRPHRGLVLDQEWLPRDARVVVQVSRWDRLKDMAGVLTGFAEHLGHLPPDSHLLLVGPDVAAVSDDPEGAQVLAECRELWRGLGPAARARAHLCCLPMDDVDENAHLVNALQRYATVVVQKSLVEGFGLTVLEPMWKARPVVASAVGGIQDQIVDGISGILLQDPFDLDEFGSALRALLNDEELTTRLGSAARERVRDRFLGDRHLIQYGNLFEALIHGG